MMIDCQFYLETSTLTVKNINDNIKKICMSNYKKMRGD